MANKKFSAEDQYGYGDDASNYSSNAAKPVLDDDKLSPFEETFMNGFEDDF